MSAFIVVAFAVRFIPDVAPESDFALIDIGALNVLRDWQPVGAYSRFGWHHPGPLYFWLLVPAYALSGFHHLGTVATVGAVNVLSVLGVLAILRRHVAMLAGVAAVILGIYIFRVDGLLASIWNPHVPLFPLLLLLTSTAAVTIGRISLLPLCLLLASFTIQTHVGLAVVAAVAAGVAVGSTVWAAVGAKRSEMSSQPLVKAIVVGAAVVGVCWVVPLVDEVRMGANGNLARIVDSATSSVPFNPRRANHVFEQLVVAPFTPDLKLWDTPLPRQDVFVRRLVLVQGSLLIASTLYWWRVRERFARNLGLLLLAVSVVGLGAMRRLPEEPKDYTVLWVSMVGVLSWITISGMVVHLLASRTTGVRVRVADQKWFMPAAAVLLGAIACLQIVAQYGRDAGATPRIRELAQLIGARLAETGAPAAHIRVPAPSWGLATGVVLQLDRAGTRTTVDPERVEMFGRRFAPTIEDSVTIQFANVEEHAEDLRYRTDYKLLGRAQDVFVYAVEAVPAARLSETPGEVVDQSRSLPIASRLLDGRSDVRDEQDLPGQSVLFVNDGDFVTVRVPPSAIGIRLWGQPGSHWQLRCSANGSEFNRLGRVGVATGPGTLQGETYLRSLASCIQLRVASVPGSPPYWLTEIQFLER
jgi:hypothetical protein